MFNNFGVNVTNLFKVAEEERLRLKHPYVGTEHLLLAILKCDEETSLILNKYGLTYEKFKKELQIIVGSATKECNILLYTPLLKKVISGAIDNAKENNNGIVTPKHLIVSLLEEGEGIGVRILVGMNIDIDAIYDEFSKENKISKQKLDLLEVGISLNDSINLDEVVVGRNKEINLIIETLLRKKKNNPLLIGDAGVGKTAIIEELTRMINRREVPDSLLDSKIVSLEMGALVSGTKYRGEFEEKLTKIIKELEQNPNIILFIDEIHAMVNAGGAEGAITAGDIFKPALARGKIKCIGATTKDEYLKYFSSDKALMRRFEIINIDEPNKYETKDILIKVKNEYENHHNVIIPNEMIDKIIYYTDKFIINKKNPDKAIDFLDSVCSKVKTNNNYNSEKKVLYKELDKLKRNKEKSIKNNNYDEALKIYSEVIKIREKLNKKNNRIKEIIDENDILDVLENKTNMILDINKLDFLNNIKNIIKDKLYNVESYVDKIIEIIKEKVHNKEAFLKVLLEGGINLGKSSIVKLIAENYPNCNFIRVDLKEYKSSIDITKMIGTSQGYVGYNDKHIFSELKNGLFNIILFDNFNEAHNNVKELIKEILKEGSVTDNRGEKICFNNSYIFITNDEINNTRVGFANDIKKRSNSDINDLVDISIYFDNLTLETLNNYLDLKNVKNKNKIIKNSEYEKYNYLNIDRLIKEELMIKN